jgi:hypothetical protein
MLFKLPGGGINFAKFVKWFNSRFIFFKFITQKLSGMKKLTPLFPLFLTVFFYSQLLAGTTGSIWGTTNDSLTGKAIAGATVTISDSRFRCLSDRNGHFNINQLAPGEYNVRISMIGYVPVLVTNAQIKADSRSRLDIFLRPDIIPNQSEQLLNGKNVILETEPPAVDRIFPGISLRQQLPLKTLYETIAFEPHCNQTHIKGGRKNEVLYLVDGQPTNDLLFREGNLNLPYGSVTDLAICTSGFDAEFGNAMSGIVNIISQEGKNSTRLFLNLGTDNMAKIEQNNNQNQIEWAANGPLIVGFGGPVINLNYLFAGRINLSDTHWRNEMTRVFQSPIESNYSFLTKLKFQLAPNLSLGCQGIFQNDSWHQYAYLWQHNLVGLPEFQKTNRRYHFTLQHELSSNYFYCLQFLRYQIKNSVLGDKTEDYAALTRTTTDLTHMIVAGKSQWWEKGEQNGLVLKADMINQFKINTEIKYGIEFHRLHAQLKQLRYTEVPVLGDATQIGFIADNNDFNYHPYTLSAYFQTQFRYSEIRSTLGLRMDAFDAGVKSPGVNFQTTNPNINLPPKASRFRSRISPRLRVNIALTPQDILGLNYGWFFQLPPFYYFYKNLSTPLNGTYALYGNPELSFEKTILYELSYHRELTDKIRLGTSIFQKDVAHLTGTKVTRLPATTLDAPTTPLAYAEYVNNGHGTINGLEFTLEFQPVKLFSGEMGYALLKATGTASRAEDPFYRMIWGISEVPDEISLDWEQKHSFFIKLNLDHQQKWGVHLWSRIGSPLPSIPLESTIAGRTRFSNWSTYFALKAYSTINSGYGSLSPYIQINNLFNTPNYIGFDTQPFPASHHLDDPTLYEPARHIIFGMNYHFN